MPKPPDSIPLTPVRTPSASPIPSLQPPGHRHTSNDSTVDIEGSGRGSSSDLEHLSKEVSRQGSPFTEVSHPASYKSRETEAGSSRGLGKEKEADEGEGSGVVVFDAEADADADDEADMPSDLRHSMEDKGSHRQPLLDGDKGRQSYEDDSRPSYSRRSSRFQDADLEREAHKATRKRYTIAAGFLLVSLVSFIVQTETAVYIQHNLKWNKAFCML